mgnify:CR=1 FL=1|jgi:hypothetical protein
MPKNLTSWVKTKQSELDASRHSGNPIPTGQVIAEAQLMNVVLLNTLVTELQSLRNDVGALSDQFFPSETSSDDATVKIKTLAKLKKKAKSGKAKG